MVAPATRDGRRASSSGNMQSYSIVVTRDRALRERLHAPHLGQDMVPEAPGDER